MKNIARIAIENRQNINEFPRGKCRDLRSGWVFHLAGGYFELDGLLIYQLSTNLHFQISLRLLIMSCVIILKRRWTQDPKNPP